MDRRRRGVEIRRLFSFPLLRTAGEGAGGPPSEEELLFELAGENPQNLLFGRFGPDAVRDRLARAGILAGIERKGYADPRLVLECRDPADQRVSLFAGAVSRDRLLLEARLELRRFLLRKPVGPFTGESSFRMLIIHWLCLSDADGSFSAQRPRLPGQRRPGLGLLPQSIDLLGALGRELALDGILDVPDHFHTALFYSRAFRFLTPEREGYFQAIVRDLTGVPLALASEAVDLGCLVRADTGERLPWEPAEQILPIRGALRRYLVSPGYRRLRDAALAGLRVAVDWDRYRAEIADRGAQGKYP